VNPIVYLPYKDMKRHAPKVCVRVEESASSWPNNNEVEKVKSEIVIEIEIFQ